MLRKPYVTVVLHFTGGFLLDVVDGITARHLDQCKSFNNITVVIIHMYPSTTFFHNLKVKFRWTSIKCFHDKFNCGQENNTVVMETFD